ncbi:MAG: response regulator transcription factor [Candidatus Methylacidiphilales bacterium]|nr:response regulator transcription factor [Candidatus Methylacidiphilales bacterium]
MNILLVEDDPIIGSGVKAMLHKRDHLVTWERGSRDIKAADVMGRYDAVIMDISLPGRDGREIVQSWRSAGVPTPVIFLSALTEVADRVRGLRVGGDDYLTKPFAFEELLARLDALVRRGEMSPPSPPRIKNWKFDTVKRRITSSEGTAELQPREWALLEVLMQNAGKIITKGHLLEKVWDIRFDPGTNVVDAMVCKLRNKLEVLGGPAHIETVRGKGYVFHHGP